jgi:hypothetical protein
MTKEEIVAAIRRAGEELGRAPSRGELKRLTGVSHYRVLAEFRTLREAIRAAGLEPNPKGERISTDELIRDWKRVGKKLGRRPSRAEYVREGKYSAGALTGRFGSWSAAGEKIHRGGAETRRTAKEGGRELTRLTRIKTQLPESPKLPKNPKCKDSNHKGHEETRRANEIAPRGFDGDKAIAFQWAASLAKIPGPLEGKRRVTEAVAAMVVSTLLGASTRSGDLVIGRSGDRNGVTDNKGGYLGPSLAVKAPLVQDDRRMRADCAARGVYKDRPVMGPPFSRHPLTNAPVNEMGVVFLFALVAWDLGFQVESLWGRYPDGRAKREVAPGKWQEVALEFEYESKNFVLHGHDPKDCDVIVCWRHNWRECPEEIEVVELCRTFGRG